MTEHGIHAPVFGQTGETADEPADEAADVAPDVTADAAAGEFAAASARPSDFSFVFSSAVRPHATDSIASSARVGRVNVSSRPSRGPS
jgi:hypothetical protein